MSSLSNEELGLDQEEQIDVEDVDESGTPQRNTPVRIARIDAPSTSQPRMYVRIYQKEFRIVVQQKLLSYHMLTYHTPSILSRSVNVCHFFCS